MDIKELRAMSDKVLNEELKKLREQHFDLRSQTVTEKVTDTSQFSKLRKDIARAQTELSARRHKAAKAAKAGK
jgi:large subunit ribosomal protein L29